MAERVIIVSSGDDEEEERSGVEIVREKRTPDDRSRFERAVDANWMTRALKVPVHGMMDFLHGTVLRFGSGGWRATTQGMEYIEDENVKEFFENDEPPSKRDILKQKAGEGYEDLPTWLKGLSAQPYADPTPTIDFLKGGGGNALAKGFWEGFTYDPDVDVESAWDITASGTAETRALDFLASPAGPGRKWIEENPVKATAYGMLLDIGYDPLTIFPYLITAPLSLGVKALVAGVKKAHKTILYRV